MIYSVEVDQSGKVEETTTDTVLAYSNGITFTLLITKEVKRNYIKAFRAHGFSGKEFYLRLFVIGLFYLLKDIIERTQQIFIDHEYYGHDGRIKDLLINFLLRAGYAVDYHQIQFKYIGKHSRAHTIALSTLRKELKPNRIITTKDILGELKQ